MEKIHRFWSHEAERLLDNAISTHRDSNQSLLELDELLSRLEKIGGKDRLLVVGCGNGYGAELYSRYFKNTFAVDYVGWDLNPHGNVEFQVASTTNLPFKSNSFDVAVTKRVIINLPSWSSQKQALKEIHRVLKPNGVCLMLEATQQGYSQLNRLRRWLGLSEIKVAWHNLPLDTEKLHLTNQSILNVYYLVSRLIHPLLKKEPRYDSKINVLARMLQRKLKIPWRVSPLALFTLVKK